MHIADGVLSPEVIIVGTTLTVIGTGIGLYKMDYEKIPRVGVLASAFFVASLIHVRVPPTSVHLILNGLLGVLLGWAVFPALLIGLFLQAVFFGHGGLTTLGVNTLNFALPALICYYLFNKPIRKGKKGRGIVLSFFAGAIAIALSTLMLGASLYLSGKEFMNVVKITAVAHVPIMVIEGIITGFTVAFLYKVEPNLLSAPIGKGFED